MKKTVLILFALILGLNIQAQRQRGNINHIPQTNREPTEQELAKRERDMEERKEEYINNFLTTLEADEFQKHIIKQSVNSFFEARLAILKTRFDHRIDREDAIKKLEDTHFIELKELVSESDMSKIDELIKGEFKEKEVVKEKKKKRKKRKKGND